MKVICIDSKSFGNVSENCEYEVIEENEGYRIISDFIYPKECFKKVKENQKQQYKILEVLNLKDGEIYRSEERTIIREGINIIIKNNSTSQSMVLSLSDKFIKVEEPKPVSTVEAFKALEKGKIIESCKGYRYKKTNGYIRCECKGRWVFRNIEIEELEGQWIIKGE